MTKLKNFKGQLMLKNTFFINIMFLFLLIMSIFAPILAFAAEDLNKELAYRVQFSKVGDVDILLKEGANPNYVNSLGFPMVAVAVSRNDSDALPILKALIEGGADANQGGDSNQYPIIIAINNNNLSIVKYLADEQHANMRIKDLNGKMPLEIAQDADNAEIIEIVKAEKLRQDGLQQALKSPQRRNIIMKNLTKLYCEKLYLEHYFAVKLDEKTPEEIKEVMDKYPPQFEMIIADLSENFNINVENFIKYVNNFVKKRLYPQFGKMPSNRMRRKMGFGTQKDMNLRCNKIVDEIDKKLPKITKP